MENSLDGKIMKLDVIIAKNFLNKEEIRDLEGIVSAFLELAENRANLMIFIKIIKKVITTL